MKKIFITLILISTFSACSTLSGSERMQLNQLRGQGITIDKPIGSYIKPKSAILAGVLNIFPGFGNFYLGMGNSGESEQYIFGFLNLLTWPLSIIWGIPEAAIDANTINKKELIYYYKYDSYGKMEIKKAGIKLD